MSSLLRYFWKGVLATAAISIVASTVYLPEARIPVVIWLLGIALIWRPSPGSDR
jgi:hypothetical protein